ncbi:uncharacterized protein LOC132560501 [Ylistrum balloti]|uniref:uncharacterized protein LOC132560501 n=1 Tax=Ylistrum balloti TaxID=509963 RepID=UPI002905E4A1|nr:uncharacterized protein LOC132560501 [Ylistrum balloti]
MYNSQKQSKVPNQEITTDIVLTARQKCLTCSYISHPWFCDNYTHCEDGEICHIRKMITHNGHIQYTSGCVSDKSCSVDGSFHGSFGTPYGHVACVECCHGDFCNNKGCGDPGPPSRATRGPLCFQCEKMTSPSDCRTLASCSSDQVCSITESLTDSGSIFTTACAAKNRTNPLKQVTGLQINFKPKKNIKQQLSKLESV